MQHLKIMSDLYNPFSSFYFRIHYCSKWHIVVTYLFNASRRSEEFKHKDNRYPDDSTTGHHPTNGSCPLGVRSVVRRLRPVTPVENDNKLWKENQEKSVVFKRNTRIKSKSGNTRWNISCIAFSDTSLLESDVIFFATNIFIFCFKFLLPNPLPKSYFRIPVKYNQLIFNLLP